MRRPDLSVVEVLAQAAADLADAVGALADHGAMDLPLHQRGRGAGPVRIRKHVEVRQRRPFEIPRKLSEVLIGFSGKADDDVGTDRDVWNLRANAIDERRVLIDRVRPAHGRQNAVARVLQRQMKVRGERFTRRDEIDDVQRAIHRLERADAKESRKIHEPA